MPIQNLTLTPTIIDGFTQSSSSPDIYLNGATSSAGENTAQVSFKIEDISDVMELYNLAGQAASSSIATALGISIHEYKNTGTAYTDIGSFSDLLINSASVVDNLDGTYTITINTSMAANADIADRMFGISFTKNSTTVSSFNNTYNSYYEASGLGYLSNNEYSIKQFFDAISTYNSANSSATVNTLKAVYNANTDEEVAQVRYASDSQHVNAGIDANGNTLATGNKYIALTNNTYANILNIEYQKDSLGNVVKYAKSGSFAVHAEKDSMNSAIQKLAQVSVKGKAILNDVIVDIDGTPGAYATVINIAAQQSIGTAFSLENLIYKDLVADNSKLIHIHGDITLNATAFDDVIDLTSSDLVANTISGIDIKAGAGNDVIFSNIFGEINGGAGQDRIVLGSGMQFVTVGLGDANISGSNVEKIINFKAGEDQLIINRTTGFSSAPTVSFNGTTGISTLTFIQNGSNTAVIDIYNVDSSGNFIAFNDAVDLSILDV